MSVLRFRILRPLPPRLDYSGASFALEIVRQRHETIPVNEWVFRARKVGAPAVCVIANALAFRSHLERALEEGFDVEAGTPAARVMRRLVRDRIAVETRPGRR